ncbi:MAG: bifunctional molybdenum cofactor biosynthesis protein MoaC/MoaB [Chlamydiota bacterium]|nr:bifunctional molybdenum cofactor biosynthesis protein MoaC/MoaB [Chlamydiota bacterium]
MKKIEQLSHLDEKGKAYMVPVGAKRSTHRVAVAQSQIRVQKETLDILKAGKLAKGDAFCTAKIAAIMAAKKTSEIIPLCHPLALDHIDIKFQMDQKRSIIAIQSTVSTIAKTGVEMEALAAVSVAALTLYDMLKGVDKNMEIVSTKLIEKKGGKSDWTDNISKTFKAAVMVASDRVFAKKRQDQSGKFIQNQLKRYGIKSDYIVVPDEKELIMSQMSRMIKRGVALIITTGGTGLGPRDVTVEATRNIMDREIPGIMEAIRTYGLTKTPYAMLSRGIAAQKDQCMIINLPGSLKGVEDSLNAIFPYVLHVYPMMKGMGH